MATNHIITATFKAGRRKTSTRPISQYDYGQLLKFEGFELPDHYEVQFSNYPNGGATVPQIGDSTGVQIPYSLCATGLPIYAHLFLHDDATDGETVYTVTIPVDGRPYPANGTPTSAEESALTQAITALQAIEPRVDAAEEDIDGIQAEMLTKADATTVQGALNDIADIQEDITTLQARGIELAEDVSVIGDQLSGKVDKVEGKGLSTEDYTTAEKSKLAGIAAGAQVNANGFGTFRVKTGTYQYQNFQAGNPNDVLKITPGVNINMGGYGDELTINAWFPEASQDGAGLMSAADKTAVDGLNDIIASGGISVPHTVRNAILALFEAGAYAETGLEDEIAVIEAWAEEVTSLELSVETLSVVQPSTGTITATVVPSTATVTWESSDTSIATVVGGVVTGVSNGTAIITASAGDKSARCTVTVSGFVTLESISAVYTQSGTVYDTDSLDSLKSDLVVTAHYSDSSTAVVTTYTLSGTLAEGTSTITVAYGGKTTTFTVTVTEDRGIPANYTWLYDARNGEVLSEQNYVTKTESGTTSETVSNGILRSHVDNNGSASTTTSKLLTYTLTDTTTTNATLTAKAKLVDCPDVSTGTTAIGQRLQLSNGTSGAQAFLEASGTKINVAYVQGSTQTDIVTDFNVDEYHIFELQLQNGHQIFKIDGTTIFDSSTLASSYCTENMIRLQATNTRRTPNGVTTDFEWVAYYEE